MKEIALTQGKIALVDDEDYELLSAQRWFLSSYGYAVGNFPHPKIRKRSLIRGMHRVIMGLGFGDKRVVDHIDGNPLNNCRSNLRVCSHSQNMKNKKHQVASSNRMKGASKNGNRWRAIITTDGVRRHLGSFETEEEAHAAYRAAAVELHGEFARFE